MLCIAIAGGLGTELFERHQGMKRVHSSLGTAVSDPPAGLYDVGETDGCVTVMCSAMAANCLEGDDSLKDLEMKATTLQAEETSQSNAAACYTEEKVGVAHYEFDAGAVTCFFVGEGVENAGEMRELYGLSSGNYDSAREVNNCAQLLLDLYLCGFTDEYSDSSDQPATALAALVGEYAFVIVDTSNARSLLIARSSDRAPEMWWGTASGGALLVALSADALSGLCDGAMPFPASSYFAASSADGPAGSALSQLVAFRKPILHRGVHTAATVNSTGALCGMGYYTQSGTMLSAMAM